MRSAPTIPELLLKVMEPTYEMLRVEHMGWKFGKPTIKRFEGHGLPMWTLRVAFTCVCGREEVFQNNAFDLQQLWYLNVPLWLLKNGSFSREHLVRDGYTEEEILEIERKGEEFDRIVMDHLVVAGMRGQLGKYDSQKIQHLLMRDERYAG